MIDSVDLRIHEPSTNVLIDSILSDCIQSGRQIGGYSRPWTSFNGFKPAPHRHMTCTCDCTYSLNVFLMMGAESTRNM
jgi:hypothetical protein